MAAHGLLPNAAFTKRCVKSALQALARVSHGRLLKAARGSPSASDTCNLCVKLLLDGARIGVVALERGRRASSTIR